MKLKIELELDNDAFGPDWETTTEEATRIIQLACERWKSFGLIDATLPLFDKNGNKVGQVICGEE